MTTTLKLLVQGALVMTFVTACNSLFYHPLKEIVQLPSNYKLLYREIKIPTPDQELLNGWAIAPKKNPQNIVVLQLHGNAENRSTHFVSAAWMAYHGVDVVTFDYRGYDGSSGTPSRDGLVVDSIAAMEWVVNSYPHHRRYVLGQSLGGALATVALAQNKKLQDFFSGFIIESAFHSYQGIARMKFASSWLLWCFQWLPYILLSGSSDPKDSAPQIHIPTIAFHRREDPVVPFESGKKLYDAFPEGVIKTHVLDGIGHTDAFYDPDAGPQTEMLKFIGVKKS